MVRNQKRSNLSIVADTGGVLSKHTSIAVFERLQKEGVPVAYASGENPRSRVMVREHTPIPLEYVVCRYRKHRWMGNAELEQLAHPYCEIHLPVQRGQIVTYSGREITILRSGEQTQRMQSVAVLRPKEPYWRFCHPTLSYTDPTLFVRQSIDRSDIVPEGITVSDLRGPALKAFGLLEQIWRKVGSYLLVSCRFVLGVDPDGYLLLTGALNQDSWVVQDKKGERVSMDQINLGAWRDALKK